MNDYKECKETPAAGQGPSTAEPEVRLVPVVDRPVSSAARAEPNRVPTVEEMEHFIADQERAADHRFKKGVSGNPRGRPRKVERSFTPRQHRRDILRIAEATMTIRTEKSKKKVSVIEAVIRLTVARALTGHGPSMNRVVNWYLDAINEHNEVHEKRFSILEGQEVNAVLSPDEESEWRSAFLNGMRRLTRRT